MSTDPDNERINQLINEKRYEEAKALLRQASDPASQSWLVRLESLFPTPQRNVPPPQRLDYGTYGLEQQKYGYATSSSSMRNYHPMAQYERGGCLTAFLIFIVVANVILTFLAFSVIQLIFGAFILACVAGVWNQQKWGYFGLMVAYTLNLLVSIAVLHSVGPAVGAVIGMTIAYALINPQLESFS